MSRQPKLKRVQINSLGRILDMLYRPSEIAEEIGVSVDTIYRSYLPAGLPHKRDKRGKIWIHGPAFIAWARQTVAERKSKRQPMPDGFGWCVRCNQPVKMRNPKLRKFNRYVELLQAKCPHCGTTVNRCRKPGGER